MGDYPPNSYVSKKEAEPKPEEQKLEPVVKHQTQVRKRGAFQKFTDAFIAEDLNSVKSYVIKELLIPGIKRMFLSSLEMLLNGKGYSSNKKDRQTSYVSYRSYYDQDRREEPPRNDYPDNFEDIIFEDRGDAEYILDQLKDVLQRYRVVRVSDMFDLARQPSPYTGNRYGWTDLSLARVMPTRGGYMIKMPKAIPIDRN